MVFKMCEVISRSSFSVKELDVIVHKKIFSLYNTVILYPTSLANLVVEVGTRHSHQILFIHVSGMANCLNFLHLELL